MSDIPQKAEWCRTYDDGSEKFTVSYDVRSELCPNRVMVEFSGDQWVMVDAEDCAFLAARLLDAAAAIARAKGEPS